MCTCLVHKTSAVYQSLGCRGCSVGQGSAGSAATGGQAPFPARHHRPTQGPGQDWPSGGETTCSSIYPSPCLSIYSRFGGNLANYQKLFLRTLVDSLSNFDAYVILKITLLLTTELSKKSLLLSCIYSSNNWFFFSSPPFRGTTRCSVRDWSSRLQSVNPGLHLRSVCMCSYSTPTHTVSMQGRDCKL